MISPGTLHASVPARYGRKWLAINLLSLLVTLFATAPIKAETPQRIVMLGDSITAGYGLPAADALPTLLQSELEVRGLTVTVENAGVSGDTSAGGLSRLDWAVQGQPDLVVVALGANDGLRGVDPADTRRNLGTIVDRLSEKDVPVLLVGMLAPPNMGAEYGAQFNEVYPALSEEKSVPLYPFLLDGVAADPDLNQSDGIHPNAEGAAIIAAKLADPVAAILKTP